MKKIMIADATLRSGAALVEGALGFKEKIGILRQLERLSVDIIETAPLRNGKTDILFLHSAASLVSGILSCPSGLNETELRAAWDAVKGAKHPRLHLLAPVSTVQMEYMAHQKPAAVLESIASLTKLAKEWGEEIEVSLLDATRAEMDFLKQAASAAADNGADVVTLCDSAGTMFPAEIAEFITSLTDSVPKLKEITLSVQCSDQLHMASACAASCIQCGVTQIKTAVNTPDMLKLNDFADLINLKGRSLDSEVRLNVTALRKLTSLVEELLQGRQSASASAELAEENAGSGKFLLSRNDDMESVAAAVRTLGYELSAEDLSKVYEEFRRIVDKKNDIGSKDLDAIVAMVALQAPPVYRLKSFVITSGNIVNAMAHVTLEKDGEELSGFSMGDGPVDAAFRSIENIIGRHFELDDFKISAVTEGREAVGSSVVRLRSRGKLYSGKGVSTDIIGAAIRGYVNALNKICFDEEEKE